MSELVDTKSKEFKDAVKRYCIIYFCSILHIPQEDVDAYYANRKGWCEEAKTIYKNAYSLAYSTARAEAAKEKQNLLLKFISTSINDVLSEFGIEARSYHDGSVDVRCRDSGKAILNIIFEEKILPKFEEMGIKGIKLKRNASAATYNIFDWSNVEINTDEN